MTPLDKHTIERIENLIPINDKQSLEEAIQNITNSLFDDGFNEEDIYEYFKYKTIQVLEE